MWKWGIKYDSREYKKYYFKSYLFRRWTIRYTCIKRGNALRLHGVTNRESQDLDFSIGEEIRFTEENEGQLLKKTLTSFFSDEGYLVNAFIFKDKPKKRKDVLPPFWGGYSITFSIIDIEKYREKIEQEDDNLNTYAEPLLDGTKK